MEREENIRNTFRYIAGSYYGIRELDEYSLKEFVLKDIKDYLDNFVLENPIKNFDFDKEFVQVDSDLDLKTKLQDSLLVLPKIGASMELVLLVKKRIKLIDSEKKHK